MNDNATFPFNRLFALVRTDGDDKRDDKGTRAGLRCLLSGIQRRHVIGQMAMGQIGAGGFVGHVVGETVAGLFARHPKHDETLRNFGTTCRRIRDTQSSSTDETAAFDSHFRRLLSARTREEACDQVKRIARMAEAKGIPINYKSLFFDLQGWETEWKGMVPRQWWTRAYFNAASSEDTTQPPAPPSNE